jgi:hypothetical protein
MTGKGGSRDAEEDPEHLRKTLTFEADRIRRFMRDGWQKPIGPVPNMSPATKFCHHLVRSHL